MNTVYSEGDVKYYLIKRKPTKGKPVYHARFLDSKLDEHGRRRVKFSRSTGETNEALAHKRITEWMEEGIIDSSPTSLRTYLLDFWDPEKSDYLKNKGRQGKVFSRDYIRANVSVIERYLLPHYEKQGITDLHELDLDNLKNGCKPFPPMRTYPGKRRTEPGERYSRR